MKKWVGGAIWTRRRAPHRASWVVTSTFAGAIASTIAGPIAGCAGGESDTIGQINLSGGAPDGQTSGADEGSSGTTGSATFSNPTVTETTDAETTSAPETTGEPGTATSGPGLACTVADDCDDANPCTNDNCLNSTCDHQPIDCDDGLPCTTDTCDPGSGACMHAPDDTACADANLCNGIETCDAVAGCVAGTPVTCSDAQACTADVCEPSTGMCSFEAIDTCTAGDGCCPVGCSVADTDCTCSNLAMSATATSSGGGAGNYGPSRWVDGADETTCDGNCTECFGWIDNGPTANGAWMQLTWNSPQLIGSMFLDGLAAGSCQAPGRALAGGDIQYWSAGSWVTAATFGGESGDLDFSFDTPFTTDRVRIYNAVAPAGGFNSLVFEWYVYEPLGCTP